MLCSSTDTFVSVDTRLKWQLIVFTYSKLCGVLGHRNILLILFHATVSQKAIQIQFGSSWRFALALSRHEVNEEAWSTKRKCHNDVRKVCIIAQGLNLCPTFFLFMICMFRAWRPSTWTRNFKARALPWPRRRDVLVSGVGDVTKLCLQAAEACLYLTVFPTFTCGYSCVVHVCDKC